MIVFGKKLTADDHEPQGAHMSIRRTHIITFATPNYRQAADIQAKAVRHFSQATHMIYGPDHPVVQKLISDHPDHFRHKKGFGYWLWKPYIIRDALSWVPEGEHVLYLDAGVAPVNEMDEWLAELQKHNIAFVGHDPCVPITRNTKRDCFIRLDSDNEETYRAPEVSGGFQSYRSGPEARAFVEEFMRAMTIPGMNDDSPSTLGLPELPDFIAHRHDQSVLSIIAHKQGAALFTEPSQYGRLASHSMRGTPESPFLDRDKEHQQIFDVHRLRNRPAYKFYIWRWKRRRALKKLGFKSI